jgi:predicted deacylase
VAILEFQVTQVQVYRATLVRLDIAVYRGTQVFQVTLASLGTQAFQAIQEVALVATQELAQVGILAYQDIRVLVAIQAFLATQDQALVAILVRLDIAVYRGTQVFQVTQAFLGIREAVYRDTQAVEFLAIQESAGILASVDTLELVVILEYQAIQEVASVATQEAE